MTLFMRDEEKRAEGRAEGRAEAMTESILKLIRNGQSKDFILALGYSEEEIAKAEQLILTTV